MDSTKVYGAIRHMTKKQLVRELSALGFKTNLMTAPTMRDVVRSLYQDGKLSGESILKAQETYGGYAH